MILLQEQAVNNEEKSYKDNDQSCKKKRKLQTKNVSTHNISNLKKKSLEYFLSDDIRHFVTRLSQTLQFLLAENLIKIAYLSSI